MKCFERFSLITSTLFLLALAGCDSDSDSGSGGGDAQGGTDTAAATDTPGEEDPLAETAIDGCDHLQLGPFVALTVGAAADATAPLVEFEHQTDTVTLAAGGAQGFLRTEVAEDALYLFATTRSVTLTIQAEDGTAVAPDETPDLTGHCAAMVAAWVFDLEPGIYYIGLEPAADETEVDLYANRVGTDEHEHEE